VPIELNSSITGELAMSYNPFKIGRINSMPKELSDLRQKLNRKAKQSPKYRFYSLYGHLFRRDVLGTAWEHVSKKSGETPGIDGITAEDIGSDAGGVNKFLTDLQVELKEKRYRAKPVKRIYIPKGKGKMRPLGIPTLKDRVVQLAVHLILEPIFEADFLDCSYGFRPGKSAHHALDRVRSYLDKGYTSVYDADLKGYFDSIPHDKLLKCVRMRVTDRSILRLIRMWLKAPVVEYDSEGKTRVQRPDKGTPQGGVLSPLLANIYLHWFDVMFHRRDGPADIANAKLVRYADDFLVLARYQGERLIRKVEFLIEEWLDLEINREKTRIVNLSLKGEKLDFLGYSFRFAPDKFGRQKHYLKMYPSKKALKAEKRRIRTMTGKKWRWVPVGDVIAKINENLRGWSNYFNKGYHSKEFRLINHFVRSRLGKFLTNKSQRPYKVPKGLSIYKHLTDQGLMQI